MSLINEEKKRISDIACKMQVEEKKEKESYYLERADKRTRTALDIQAFDFDSPLELQKQLCEMWSGFSDEKMLEFLKVCCVSAFKNKESKEQRREVSTYIYEF